MILPDKDGLVRPIHIARNPRSKSIINDFISMNTRSAEVDTSWSSNKDYVYNKLHKFLSYNQSRYPDVILRKKGGRIFLINKSIPESPDSPTDSSEYIVSE